MELKEISALAADSPQYKNLRDHLTGSRVIQLEGMAVSAKGFFLAQLRRDTRRPLVVLSYNNEQAERIATDMNSYGLGELEVSLLLSSSETLLYTEGAPDYGLIGKRQQALRRIALGEAPVVVGSAAAFLQRTIPRDEIVKRVFCAKVGGTLDLGDFERSLVRFGYERVEGGRTAGPLDTGAAASLTSFPVTRPRPIRFDFFGDEIESIRAFDTESQRSTETLESIELLPAREMPIDDATHRIEQGPAQTSAAERYRAK